MEATSLPTLILWNTIVNLPTTDEQQGVVLYERRKRPNSSKKLSTRMSAKRLHESRNKSLRKSTFERQP